MASISRGAMQYNDILQLFFKQKKLVPARE